MFAILLTLRLDNIIGKSGDYFRSVPLLKSIRIDSFSDWPYWAVFMPIWIWKAIVTLGALVGTIVWCRHPHFRFVNASHFYQSIYLVFRLLFLFIFVCSFFSLIFASFDCFVFSPIADLKAIHMHISKQC